MQDRPLMFERLTKEWLAEPSRRTEVDELISRESRRVVSEMDREDRFPLHRADGDAEARVLEAVRLAADYWSLVEPFCRFLHAAASWADPDALDPWSSGIRSFVLAAQRDDQPNTDRWMRHLPALISVMTASLSCVINARWASFEALLVEPTIEDEYRGRLSLIEATDPYAPFTNEWISQTLARWTLTGEELEDSFAQIKKSGETYRAPVGEWLHTILRPMFEDQLPDDDRYSFEFSRAEVMLGARFAGSRGESSHGSAKAPLGAIAVVRSWC